MCAILSNRRDIFAEKYAVACRTTFSENILGILNVLFKKNLPQLKRTKKSSKKKFKEDEEEEYTCRCRRKPVKATDKTQDGTVTFLHTNVSLHAPI